MSSNTFSFFQKLFAGDSELLRYFSVYSDLLESNPTKCFQECLNVPPSSFLLLHLFSPYIPKNASFR